MATEHTFSETCELFTLNNVLCPKKATGVSAYQEDDKPTIYTALCQGHGKEQRRLTGADFLPFAQAQARMEAAQHKEANPSVTATAPVTTSPFPERTSILTNLATHFATKNVEPAAAISTHDTPRPVEKTTEPEADTTPAPAPATPPAKPVNMLALLAMDQLLAKVVSGTADSAVFAELAKRTKAQEKEIEQRAKEAEQRKREAARRGTRIVHPRGADYVKLRRALYCGGQTAMNALDAALECGLLTTKNVKHRTPAPESTHAPKTPSTTPASPRGHSDEIKTQVLTLHAAGHSDTTIANTVGLPASTVYSMIKRAA